MTELRHRLYRYADRYRRRSEASGRGSAYPEVRRCARALRVTQAAILEAAEDAQGWGMPIDLSVGIQIGGGGGYGLHDSEGDYQIETWDEEEAPRQSAKGKP